MASSSSRKCSLTRSAVRSAGSRGAADSSWRTKAFMALRRGAAVGCWILERKMSCADGTAPEDDGEAPGSGLASICVSNLALKSG